jgi:hypothetical protein
MKTRLLRTLSVPKLLASYLDPLSAFESDNRWDGVASNGAIFKAMIEHCLEDGIYESECWSHPSSSVREGPDYVEYWEAARHAARIAYLIAHGWDDKPISVEFYTYWDKEDEDAPYWISDGNHRFLAAVFMGLPFICADVDEDDLDTANRYLMEDMREAA